MWEAGRCPRAKILRELIADLPGLDLQGGTRGQTQTTRHVRSGGFSEPVGRLRSLGIAVYPEKNAVRAADWLFLENGDEARRA